MYREWQGMVKDMNLSADDLLRGHMESVKRHAADMTAEERQSLVDKAASNLYLVEKAMARRGIAHPGNNPEKPN